jgi:hypothetical protein
MNFAKLHELQTKFATKQPVAETDMHAAGFPKPILDAAKALNISWLGLLQLFVQYGPQLLAILQSILAAQGQP